MLDTEHAKHVGDAVALMVGASGTLAQWSDFAGELTPILSLGFVSLSILWLLWRIADRIKYGPGKDDR